MNYLYEGFKSNTRAEQDNAHDYVDNCSDEIEDIESCFKKAEKLCPINQSSKDNISCTNNFKSCEFGGSSQWEKDGFLSLRDCVQGQNYALKICKLIYKDPVPRTKAWSNFITCIMNEEDNWKAKGTTNNLKSPTSKPLSNESKCMNAADFQGCMNYYSGNTYSPPPSNNRSNSNGFQIWQDSINSQKELRRKFKMDNLEYRIDKMETDALRNRLSP